MKRTKTYQIFGSEKELTLEQETFLNECTTGQWKFDSLTGLVDVGGDFNCSAKGLTDLKDVKFGKISGGFYCQRNGLTSLEGSPREVGENYWCSHNRLSSLEGCPKKVGKDFYCMDNGLTSLKGSPQKVGNDFGCHENKLQDLEGGPQNVGGGFWCYDNRLSSLKGSPKEVGGLFWCGNNLLKNLEGAPEKVGEGFFCPKNNLESLKGVPLEIGTEFVCDAFGTRWTLAGIFKILGKRKPKAHALIISILTKRFFSSKIRKNPASEMLAMKKIWNDPGFQEVKKDLVTKFPTEFGDVDKTIASLNKLDSIKYFI